ncbi:DDE Tnp4 domain-containing protein [Trichonephila clavipes]|nr:DDE Tnp4 domain-containing protein [Trichonephila clavipes]
MMLGMAKVVFSILLSDMTAIGRAMESGRRGYGSSSGWKDSESYCRFLRMDVLTFEELVALVSPSIERKNTSMRKANPAAERIALTLRYLTTGETQSSLSYQFRIAQNIISGIIPAVCAAIYHHLGSEIDVPESENEWKMVAEEFWAKWNFPLCFGAMDGKHIRIKPPSHS